MPNNACNGQVGTRRVFRHFSWLRFFSAFKQSPRPPQEQEMVKREIESMDGRIDRLVYELYGLSEDEIRIVES